MKMRCVSSKIRAKGLLQGLQGSGVCGLVWQRVDELVALQLVLERG